MRSLRVAVWHDLPSGGGRRALGGHVEGLVRNGHQVRIWSTPQPVGPLVLAEDVAGSVSQVQLGVPERPAPQLAHSLNKLLLTRSPNSVRVVREHLSQVAAQVRAWAPDVLFGNSSERLGVAGFAQALPDVPSVLYCGEPFRASYEDLGSPSWRAIDDGRKFKARLQDVVEGQRQRLLARDEWLAVRAYDRILVNSIYSREAMRRCFDVDAMVCRLGVDPDIFIDSGRARQPFFLVVGQFERHKRPMLIVDALAATKSKVPLIWVSNRVNESLLAAAQHRAGVAGVSLTIRQGVTDEELVRLYGTCIANVCAPALEPFGYTPIEAAFCGAPTVGVAEAGLRETVVHGRGGLLANPDPLALAECLDRVAGDSQFASTLGSQAKADAHASFTLRDSQRQLIEHIENAVR